MKRTSRLCRVAIALALSLPLVVTTAQVAGAAPAPSASDVAKALDSRSFAAPRPTANAAACPQPGQRVKTSSSPAVYLVDPNYLLNWIPGETEYFNLWNSWSGIATYNNLFTECYSGYYTMRNAHLAKLSSGPAIYIWDAQIVSGGAYRWITSEAVFNKYAFAWSKVRTQSSIGPIAVNYPWNF
ncbi:hypothetical protein [Lentzea flava]|uniref:Peptidase inhibitor family I36 n=1 Tax=Lentzea flava TaxID=103732 RepID=A0ABQ2VHK3_9PSEU|nr:hypothetical protein [Lentzea flava]MCP2204999.1 hypothetical protein [Lentzea flava]GGU82716.1 hypothetical protein GCM10010178_86530 [Lentzea flava]